VIKLILGFFLFLALIAYLATPTIEKSAAERIGNRIPGDSVRVHLWALHVEWFGLDWNGIQADTASLKVPVMAALTHFATGKPVASGKIEARSAVVDVNHEAMKSIKSAFTAGGIRKRRIRVESAVVDANRIATGYRIIASDVVSDIGRFRYQGDIENVRFTNGTMRITDATRQYQVLYFNMASLTYGIPKRTESGEIDITW
jgi:hypothetical protein